MTKETPQRSPLDIMHEIEATLHPPLPEPPPNASWVNKDKDDWTEEESREYWDFLLERQTAIATRPHREPQPGDERYVEYQQAKSEYESWFQLKPEDLFKRLKI